jgi:hypothetical protein
VEYGATAWHVGSSILLHRSVVHGTRPGISSGAGVTAEYGASVEVRASAILDNAGGGITAAGDGSAVTLDGALVSASGLELDREIPALWDVHGLKSAAGASMTARRVRVEAAHGRGIYVNDATFDGSDVLLHQTGDLGEDAEGRGLIAAGGEATLRRAAIDGVRGVGVLLSVGGARVVLEDVLVRDARPEPVAVIEDVSKARLGFSVLVADGHLEARRMLIESGVTAGAFLRSPEASASFEDVIVRRHEGGLLGFGVGMMAADGASVVLQRAAVADVRGAGLLALPASSIPGEPPGAPAMITGSDLYLNGMRTNTIRFEADAMGARTSGPPVAYGLHVGAACTLEATRALLLAGGYGVYAAGGRISMHTALIGDQADAAGARDGAGSIEQDHVHLSGNAVDEILVRDDLPAGAALPAPTRVCPECG